MDRRSPAPPARQSLGEHARGALAQSWAAFHPGPALYCVPAVGAVLASGLLAGQPGPAMLAAAGAFSAGFGAFQRFTRLHVAPMLLAAVCMAGATAIGTVISVHPHAYALAVGLAAFGLGIAASLGTGPWWVLLQGAIFLVIAGSRPGDLGEGLGRGMLVLGGGLIQAASVAILRTVYPAGFPKLSPPNATSPPDTPAAWRAAFHRVLHPDAPEMRYGVLLGLGAAAAVLLERRLHMPNGYWVTMTVLLVLRRGGAETVTRGLLRIGGTLLGASLATLAAALLRPAPPTLVMLALTCGWGAYALQWVNYGTFSISVTSYIAFLLALEGLPEASVAANRVVATLLGGVVAMATFGVAQLWRIRR